MPARSLLDAGEAVDRDAQARITAEAHARAAERDAERREWQQAQQVCRRLMKIRGEFTGGRAVVTPPVAAAVRDLETAVRTQTGAQL